MEWTKLKVTELKAELKSRGLPQNGLKSELVSRLEGADAEVTAAPVETGAEEDADEDDAELDSSVTLAGDSDAAPPTEPTAEPGPTATSEESAPENMVEDIESATANDTELDLATDIQQVPEPAAPDNLPEQPIDSAPEPEEPSAPGPDVEVPSETEAATPTAAAAVDDRDLASATKEEGALPTATGNEATPPELRDIQKRKRSRSRTTSPDSTSRKRQRPLGDSQHSQEEEDTVMQEMPLDTSPPRDAIDDAKMASPPHATEREKSPEPDAPSHAAPSSAVESRHYPGIETSARAPQEATRGADLERDVEPAIHPATSALYIRNFMRPLRAPDVRDHLAMLATPPGAEPSPDEVSDFFLDQIRTHGFAVFKSVSAASRVRNALHMCVWPDEANRKALWVDFVPPEKVLSWIETEEKQGGGRRSAAKRWVVNYEADRSGNMVAHLDEDDPAGRIPTGPAMRGGPTPPAGRPPPPMANSSSTNMIPLGPRGQRIPDAPRGPQGMGTGATPRGPSAGLGGKFNTTSSRPYVSYRFVSEEVARQRTEDMRSYYTQDFRRDLGKEINRYTFEDGTRFVDRGTEVFEGIRPPHRERERERERRGGGRGRNRGPRGGGGGRGRPGFQSRGDRYLPSLEERDERAGFGFGKRGFGNGGSGPGPGFDRRGGGDDMQKDAGRLHFDDDARDDHRDSRDSRY